MVKTVLAAMTLTLFAGGAAASDRPVRPGDRVRVTVEGEREVVNVRAGLAVGSVLGLLFPEHTWRTVDIGDSPEVSFDIGEGSRIGLAISF